MSDSVWSQASSGAISGPGSSSPGMGAWLYCSLSVRFSKLRGDSDGQLAPGWSVVSGASDRRVWAGVWLCHEPSPVKPFGMVELARLWVRVPLTDSAGPGQGFLPFLFPSAPPAAQL